MTPRRREHAGTIRPETGFTMVELTIVLAIVAILAALASAAYGRYRDRVLVNQAVTDIGAIATALKLHQNDAREFPATLGEVGFDQKLDPWGRPYQYYNLETRRGNGQARKDKKLAPLNSDFDLYSLGKDGQSKAPLVTPVSRDDVVRARDGRFIGLAKDFDP
ncbi:MAG: prepilin-type N-terminal cleavage/methylation domain-containing protein [Burkholderiales bacterium]